MAKDIVLARVVCGDQPGLVLCRGARAGDMVAQALAKNGDDVRGVFGPVIPAVDVIAQVKGWAEGEALLVLHRFSPDG
jgi:hypothetical protein